MYKKYSIFFIMLSFFLFSFINGMQRVKESVSKKMKKIQKNLQINEENSETNKENTILQKRHFWVITSDNCRMKIPYDIVVFCNRLKLGHYLYPDNNKKNPLNKIRFTQEQLKKFCDAFTNPTAINYNEDINSIMSIANSFGSYILYSFCISNYFKKLGCKDPEENQIVPMLKQLTNKITSDFIINTMVSLKDVQFKKSDGSKELLDSFMQNESYYIKEKDFMIQQMYIIAHKIFYKEYIVYNKMHKKMWEFESYTLDKRIPYIFKHKNILLFYNSYDEEKEETEKEEIPIIAILYDIDNKKELIRCLCKNIKISEDKKYIVALNNQLLCVYNIEDCNNIKIKHIEYDKPFSSLFELSKNGKKIITKVLLNNNESSILLWDLSHINWNNEDTVISPKNIIDMNNQNPNYFDAMRLNANDQYLYFLTNNNYNIIHLETLEHLQYSAENDVMLIFYNNTDLIIYEAKQKKPVFLIYNIHNVSQCLYSYEDEDVLYYKLFFDKIALTTKSSKSFILQYNKEYNYIKKTTEFIEGNISNINNKGLILSFEKLFFDEKIDKRILLYDHKGKEITHCDFKKKYKMYDPYFAYDKNNQYGVGVRIYKKYKYKNFFMPLYTNKEEEKCDMLWNDIHNCNQYAFLGHICSEKRDAKNILFIKKNSILHCILDSFQENKNFIQEHLKLAIE